jgi:hypothetical protein
LGELALVDHVVAKRVEKPLKLLDPALVGSELAGGSGRPDGEEAGDHEAGNKNAGEDCQD